MKKDLIFAPLLFVVSVLLFLLKATGLTAHIVISVVGLVVLVVYTILTKKEWKIPALEIGMRISYGLALITGIVVKIKYLAVIGVFHKIFAILFVALLIVILVQKLTSKKEKN